MIKGVIPASLIDWPGEMSSVIFLGGCSWDCCYCHNRKLATLPSITISEVYASLNKVREMIDHVIISGGEPTMWGDFLSELIDELVFEGYQVGLHTNGSNPSVLGDVFYKLKYIGMDIKGGCEIYRDYIRNSSISSVIKSMNVLTSFGGGDVRKEFRTTLYPGYINNMFFASLFRFCEENGVHNLVLQQYSNEEEHDCALSPFPLSEIKELVGKAENSRQMEIVYRGFDALTCC